MEKDNLSLAAGSAVTSGLLLAGHWFPWPYFLHGRTLPRLVAYTYGALSVLAGFSVWRSLLGERRSPVGLAVIYVVGGLSVCLAYLIDKAAVAAARGYQDEQNNHDGE